MDGLVRESCAPVYAIVAELSGSLPSELSTGCCFPSQPGQYRRTRAFTNRRFLLKISSAAFMFFYREAARPKPDDGAAEHRHLTSALSVSNWKRKIEGSLPLGQAAVKTMLGIGRSSAARRCSVSSSPFTPILGLGGTWNG